MGDTPRTDALLASKTEPVTAVTEFMRTLERELAAMTAEKMKYRARALHAESQLETRYGLRKEINTELGLTDETGDEALRKGLETIKAIKAEAQKARKQMDELHACLKEAMEWCKPCNYEHEPWLRWAKARDSHKPNTGREAR